MYNLVEGLTVYLIDSFTELPSNISVKYSLVPTSNLKFNSKCVKSQILIFQIT